jgi:predicted TIM-barrel fold metal-dependent hydrolase
MNETNIATNEPEIRISADSHVSEHPDFWEKNLPARYRDRAPRFPKIKLGASGNHMREGGWDPVERLKDIASDGIAAEVLYPTLAKDIYLQCGHDPDLAAACDRVYNDWLTEFCQEAPERLWGQAHIGLWDMDYAVSELERARNAGLRGAALWIAPPEGLPWTSMHYERFWDAAEQLDMPLGMHINSGFGIYADTSRERDAGGEGRIATVMRQAYGHKAVAMQTLSELILSGTFERHPRLKLVIAEYEVGWIPFFLEDLDRKFGRRSEAPLPKLPSEYFARNVYATFMQDGVGGYLLQRWGQDNFLFSNDYPHPGGIWPFTDDTIELTLSGVAPEARRKVLGENVARVYGMPIPAPMPRTPRPDADKIWTRTWLKRSGEFTFDKPEMGLAV